MHHLYVTLVHINLKKSKFLSEILDFENLPFDYITVDIITDKIDNSDIFHIKNFLPNQTKKLKINIINNDYHKLPSPWLLAWVHKKLMWEKFNESTVTHFMNIEDDLKINKNNIIYWVNSRRILRDYKLYPSFLRVEWDEDNKDWTSVDAVKGDIFHINKCPTVSIHQSYLYINIPRTYQGMFLYDRELMAEYINSNKYFIDDAFPHWRYAIQFPNSPLGLGEASHEGLTSHFVPTGCFSRNFLPLDVHLHNLIPDCFVHHVENKYVNLVNSDHGKVPVNKLIQN
jgi:hypothetical protein